MFIVWISGYIRARVEGSIIYFAGVACHSVLDTMNVEVENNYSLSRYDDLQQDV
jgi:hypothetical protein